MSVDEKTPYAKFAEADREWHAEIERSFPKEWAGHVRYTGRAKGEPGSVLREKYEAFAAARDEWHSHMGGTILHRHFGIDDRPPHKRGQAQAVMTPVHTLDLLAKAIEDGAIDALTGQQYIKVDARVLGWLIADSRTAHEMTDLIGCVAEYRATPCESLRQRMIDAANSLRAPVSSPAAIDGEDRSGECS